MRSYEKLRPWAVLVWLAVWQAAAMILDQPLLLVSPLQVLRRLGALAAEGSFWRAVGASSARIALGAFSGAAAGGVLAALSARRPALRQLLAPLMLAVRSVPVAAFILLALVAVSARDLSVLIAFLMALPILYAGVLGGIQAIDPRMGEMARLFRLSPLRRMRYVYLPQVLPHVRTACTTAMGLCWKAGAAAEVIGMPEGSLGAHLYQAKVYLDTPDLFAWTLTVVIVSVLFEGLCRLLLRQAERFSERM